MTTVTVTGLNDTATAYLHANNGALPSTGHQMRIVLTTIIHVQAQVKARPKAILHVPGDYLLTLEMIGRDASLVDGRMPGCMAVSTLQTHEDLTFENQQ